MSESTDTKSGVRAFLSENIAKYAFSPFQIITASILNFNVQYFITNTKYKCYCRKQHSKNNISFQASNQQNLSIYKCSRILAFEPIFQAHAHS
jgi:hypothetical protein